ncbi:MAG: hypothetical protein IPN03_17275 [Holophagales bacterium]|nr:hypothetical protein [Holophagales bacterium]
MDGALVGEMSVRDFTTIRRVIAGLGGGGVWINAGSAVIMPEVFLKAFRWPATRERREDFTTVDLDMIRHYRPHENVLKRPVLSGGASSAITGHHEILLPLLAQALVLGLEEGNDPRPRGADDDPGGRRRPPGTRRGPPPPRGMPRASWRRSPPPRRAVKAVVAGDLMLDETWFGDVSRVAPEAPVPLLALSSMSRRAGGAGNVVENLAALGARTVALGAVGPEEEGEWLRRHLGSLPGGEGRVVVDPLRTTPVKRRMVADGRQLLRVDQELPAVLSAAAEEELVAAGLAALASAEVLLLSDYSKGTLTPRVVAAPRGGAPPRQRFPRSSTRRAGLFRYRGATCITPNRKELETVTGRAPATSGRWRGSPRA